MSRTITPEAIAAAVDAAVAEAAAQPCGRLLHLAGAEISAGLSALLRSGDVSWQLATAVVMNAHDNIDYAAAGLGTATIGNHDTATITACLASVLVRHGLVFTNSTPGDRMVIGDIVAPRSTARA